MVKIMIREIVDDKFQHGLDRVIDEIIDYFGYEYSEQINEQLANVKVSLVEDKGVYSTKDGEIYVGEEPVCVKEEIPHIIIPLSFMGNPHGNVVITHLLIHLVGEDVFVKNHCDAFNEIIVDYMANEIAKQLKLKKINLTVVKPVYESNSFYSKMFSEVEQFYENNKSKIIDSRMGKKVDFDEDVDEYIYGAQSVVDSIFTGEQPINTVIKRR